tara:strand:- start:949 stop:1203 length:255 start_codon:yes stop_codon:yes gene_type:complete
MTLAEFKSKSEVEEFNTCNGWGFGGSFGKRYTLGKFYLRDSKGSTRHQGTYNNSRYSVEGLDGVDVSRAKFIKALAEVELTSIN